MDLMGYGSNHKMVLNGTNASSGKTLYVIQGGSSLTFTEYNTANDITIITSGTNGTLLAVGDIVEIYYA